MKLSRLIIGLLLFVCLNLNGQSVSFQTYMNPVIPGDHPDCTVTRIGDDFYTTGSSFNVTPVIYHSTDLVHWQAIAQPVSAAWSGYGDTPGGGCWGGHIVYYNGEYWHYFSRANVMHFVKAPDPKGPWSMPVRVNNPSTLPYSLGYDNSIFIDDDNKWYLVVKNGQPNGGIVELGNDGQPTGTVYNLSWLNPSPAYPYSWAEGPVMWKYKGYYYYSFARDLSDGQKVMRSLTLTADESAWEMLGDFFNENDPLKSGSKFTSPNHASPVVTLDDSTFWVIHPLYAKGEWKGQGRQGLLNQVRYDANGIPKADYPVNKSFTAPKLPSSGIPWMVPKSDFFNSSTLHPEWSFLGYTAANKSSLTDRPGWLRLTPKNSATANTITKNDGEHNYSLITRLDFDAQAAADEAGLWIMRGDQTMSVKLVSTLSSEGQQVIAFSFNNTRHETENTIGDTLWLKLERVNHVIKGYYSANGHEWTEIGESFNISEIDSFSDFVSFTGTRQGLYVKGSKEAWFDLYIYRDAYSDILAECPANQFGTSLATNRTPPNLLGSIHNDDWALYAGVEFGNSEYQKSCDSLKITASCFSSGGNVEVYIDSIHASTKIAVCTISNTGSWTDYQTLTTNLLQPVSDNHDVYLKFTGNGSDELFRLQYFKFTTNTEPTSTENLQGNNLPKKFHLDQNYPNPFNPATKINYSVQHEGYLSLIVYDLLGQEVTKIFEGIHKAGNYNVTFDGSELSSGVYLYQMRADNFLESKKFVLAK